MAQQEVAAQELQVVSFTEADKSDFDTTTPSNFAGKLKTSALVKVFMPGEIESTDPKPSKEIERRRTSTGYAYYIWMEQHSNRIRILPKGNKFQTKVVNFYEYGIPKYIPIKGKKGGLQAGKVYHLVLRDPSPIYIDTHLPGTYATIDNGTRRIPADANGRITLKDLATGDHTANIYASDGSTRGSVMIKESDKVYEHDARKKTRLSIRTNPVGGEILIKDGEFTEKYDRSKEYAHKSYLVIANINNNEVRQTITVDDNHTSFIINNTKTFDITPIYNGSADYATVYEDRKALVAGEENNVILDGKTYRITRPVGSKFRYYASHSNGKSKDITINVENGMNTDYLLKINPRNPFRWPWQRPYEPAPMGVAIGYVQKQMVTKGEGEKLKENGVWNDGVDKWLYGMQFGFYAQPCFSWGLGLYTGLFYEAYLSSNGSGNSDEYENFQEHNLSLPVHALYRFPLGKKCALSLHGGLGFNYVVYGAYTADGVEDNSDFYGEDGCPKRFNMALEGGVDFRIGPVQIGFTYSKGLTDHGIYSSIGDYKTNYNKLGINVAWVIGDIYNW